jgi:hypothetical protein
MSICHREQSWPGMPEEPRLLSEVKVRLISEAERERYDGLIKQEHYLHHARTVGAMLRCVAEYQVQGADYIFLLKGNQPTALAKAQQLLAGAFPPAVQTVDKAHGRIDQRRLWSQPVDGATMGLPGARQVFRIDLKSEHLRRGRVVKTTTETSYRVTSLLPEEAGLQALMDEARGYWAIENGQHDRRDHTQREDHCLVRHPQAARTLSQSFRSPFLTDSPDPLLPSLPIPLPPLSVAVELRTLRFPFTGGVTGV